jgi:hypothetical protein
MEIPRIPNKNHVMVTFLIAGRLFSLGFTKKNTESFLYLHFLV